MHISPDRSSSYHAPDSARYIYVSFIPAVRPVVCAAARGCAGQRAALGGVSSSWHSSVRSRSCPAVAHHADIVTLHVVVKRTEVRVHDVNTAALVEFGFGWDDKPTPLRCADAGRLATRTIHFGAALSRGPSYK